LAELQDLTQQSYVPPNSFAWIYLALRDIDRFFDFAEKTVEEHDHLIATTLVHPDCSALRSHPRYHALLRKMNLEA
jgi:hypothetical protein